jgi:hypothetical protein
MRYTRRLISFVILTMLVGLGSLFLITDQANAGFRCEIGIIKVADPADDTPFDFTAPGSDNPNFTLMDPSNDTDVVSLNIAQMVTVTEVVPAGWSLDNIVCGEPSGVIIGIVENGRSFECTTGRGRAVCTFFNSMEEPPPAVPTLSEWGLIAMAAILGIVGFMVIRRKKATT